MAHEDHDAFYSKLELRGVTRRDFLKFCGSMAAMLGLAESAVPQIAAAVEAGAKLTPALWINGGACTGCTESIAQVDSPDVATIVLDLLSLEYFETIMMAQGEDAEKAKADRIEQGGYVCIYEGTVMTGFEGNALRVAGKPQTEELPHLFENALAIVAIGSCAVDGGWVAARPNPAGGIGVPQFCRENGIETPVINLPTCPVNPEWLVAMVINVLMLGGLEDLTKLNLDDFNRPKLIFGQTIHDQCPRRGHFENGEFVYEFGSEEEAKGYCLYAVGCKGPQTFTNCPIVRWNRRASWCVEAGAPCIGCGSADPLNEGGNWVDVGAPFLNRHKDIRIGDMITQPPVVGGIVGAAALGALTLHGIGMKAAGRMDGGAPYEDAKEHDRKKGGGK
ncbi:MAG: hydrogenase [Actinobacteria bacterium HGW-Actinobacteria-10]|nr:MAG: hydrogenase [Actinobacteria bacterium HGW-Actinobacteria-10]